MPAGSGIVHTGAALSARHPRHVAPVLQHDEVERATAPALVRRPIIR